MSDNSSGTAKAERTTSFHSDSVYMIDENFSAKMKMVGDKLYVYGARIFKADTPMAHGFSYSPEELTGAQDGPLLFDLDHNYLAIGKGDMLLRSYMDENNEWLLGDMQFESPTLIKLVENKVLNGISIVTNFEKVVERDGKEYAIGVTIPAISLTEIPFCGKGGEVEGCGITHCDKIPIPHCMTKNRDNANGVASTHCLCGGACGENTGIGGDTLDDKDLIEKVSKLTIEQKRLEGELEAYRKDDVDLKHPKIQEHVTAEVKKAVGEIDLSEKIEHAEEGSEFAKTVEKIGTDAVETYKTEQVSEAVKEKKDEMTKKLDEKDEHTKKVIEGLNSIEELASLEAMANAGTHSLVTEGGDKAAELVKLREEFKGKLGLPIKAEVHSKGGN